MKIFHVITKSSLGGAQSVVVNLANNQVQKNEVFVISSAGGESWNALDKRVKVISIKELNREISLLDVIVFLKLVFYRFRYNPHVVHLHSSKIGILGRIAFSPFKTIYTIHGFDSIRVANRKFLFLERILKYWCRFIVGVSKYDYDNLCAEHITRNVTTIYNGVMDYSKQTTFIHSLRSLILEKRKNFKHIVMSVARDDAPKLPDLFAEIAKYNPEYYFVWIGNGKKRTDTFNLHWAGMISKAYLLMQDADLFLLPSGFEGLPMCILEAFSFSKPVVASNVGGIPELLNGENGIAVKNSVEEFSKAIHHFLDSQTVYDTACKAARKTYELDLQDCVMVNRYMELYRKIYRGK